MILDKLTGLNNNIVIVGDSWAFGEWYPIEGHFGSYIDTIPVVSHPSPQQYLHEHFKNIKVYHMAQVGGENNANARSLRNYKQHFDFGIVYWTCPSRALLNKWERTKKDLSQLTLEDYKRRVEEYSKSSLEEFNDCDMPLLFVGGQVSLPDLSDYDNCHAIVDRMTNLVEEPFWCEYEKVNKTGTVHNKIDWEGIFRLAELGHDINFSEKFLKDVHKIRIDEFPEYRFNPYYFPDQGHGSRFLHKITTDKLIEYIESNNMINTIVN
jgi:hypothetical protein